MPFIGFYCASKAAVESLHESLAQEVKEFGIKVTLLELGAYATEFASPSSLKRAPAMDAYADLRQRVFGHTGASISGKSSSTVVARLRSLVRTPRRGSC